MQLKAAVSTDVAVLRAPESQSQVDSGARRTPTDPETEARLREERRVHMENVKKDFFAEPRDANWSSATYSTILGALDATELRGAAASIECRSQTCRVELVDDGLKTRRNMSKAVLKLGQSLPKVEDDRVDDGNGHRRTVLTMSRYDDSGSADDPESPR